MLIKIIAALFWYQSNDLSGNGGLALFLLIPAEKKKHH